jgi:ribosomal protein S18 acetylase RimI-like enzyme
MQSPTLQVIQADYNDPRHAQALVQVLDLYAQDPMGGGQALPQHVLAALPGELAKRPQAMSILAFDGDIAVGLVNCFEGFSTFACRPLMNVHDVMVIEAYRGKGVSQQMLTLAETLARQRGCCKMTLEVLEGNTRAQAAYRKLGYGGYELVLASGNALFWQKTL